MLFALTVASHAHHWWYKLYRLTHNILVYAYRERSRGRAQCDSIILHGAIMITGNTRLKLDPNCLSKIILTLQEHFSAPTLEEQDQNISFMFCLQSYLPPSYDCVRFTCQYANIPWPRNRGGSSRSVWEGPQGVWGGGVLKHILSPQTAICLYLPC